MRERVLWFLGWVFEAMVIVALIAFALAVFSMMPQSTND